MFAAPLFTPAEIASLQRLVRHYQMMDPKPVEPEVFYGELTRYILFTILLRQFRIAFAQIVIAQLRELVSAPPERPQFNLSDGLIARIGETANGRPGSGAYSAMRRYADMYGSPAARRARARLMNLAWIDLAAPMNPAEEAEGLSPER